MKLRLPKLTDERKKTLLKALLLALLPGLCVLIRVCLQGFHFLYLPASEWNDELFYYKQVEAMVHFGYPRGYFGFNESHALKLSFAAWSPVLVWPWVLWGKLFGWNLLSPAVSSIVFYTVAVFCFVLWTDPSPRRCAVLSLFFLLFTPNSRYLLAGMPEVICFSLLLIFTGLALSYVRDERKSRLAAMLILGILMTWMRPYLALFLLLALFFLFLRFRKGRRWMGAVLAAGILLFAMGVYYLIGHYLSAAYFTPLFYTDWIRDFFSLGILRGIRGMLSRIKSQGSQALGHMIEGVRSGLASGLFFLMHAFLILLLFLQCLREYLQLRRRDRSVSRDGEDSSGQTPEGLRLWGPLLVRAHFLFSCICFFFALLLMYKLTEGSKHLLTFLAAGLCLAALDEGRGWKRILREAVTAAMLLFLFVFRTTSAYDFAVPVKTPQQEARMAYWGEVFAREMPLYTEEIPSFENTVIWVFADADPDPAKSDLRLTDWQMLYALPEGMGVSCCYREYILENFSQIRSRYLAVSADGPLDRLCAKNRWEELGRDDTLVVYRRVDPDPVLLSDLASAAEGGFDAVFLSMYPTEGLTDAEMAHYYGQSVYRNRAQIPDAETMELYLMALKDDPSPIAILNLGIRPDLADTRTLLGGQGFHAFRDAHPEANIALLPAAPSEQYWRALSDAEYDAVSESYRSCLTALAYSELPAYFFAADEWLVENPQNYTDDFTIAEGTALLLYSQNNLGDLHQVTAPRLPSFLERFERMIHSFRMPPRAVPDLQDTCIIVLGDSIFGNYDGPLSASGILAEETGAEVYNCAIGGSYGSRGEDKCSFLDMIGFLETDPGAGIGAEKAGVYQAAREALKRYEDGSKRVVFLLEYGTNDYLFGAPVTDEAVSEGSFEGAMRAGIERLREQYPKAEFLLLAPGETALGDYGKEARSDAGSPLSAYQICAKRIGKDLGIRTLDQAALLQFSADSFYRYYYYDGVHYNEYGRFLLARLLMDVFCEF
ncbi:MAG: SGNH/GDSL hydrolase family protein [Lachnospiraceae bacterium]|nr:SGNH/GDSL hydrolase family protein [Lachnospiraceae bacterium]